MHVKPLEMKYDRGLSTLACLFALHAFEIKVAFLVLRAIMHGNARLVVRESRHMPLRVNNMIGSVFGAYMP